MLLVLVASYDCRWMLRWEQCAEQSCTCFIVKQLSQTAILNQFKSWAVRAASRPPPHSDPTTMSTTLRVCL